MVLIMKRCAGLLVVATILSGCATTRFVDTRNPFNIPAAVEEGDRVSLTTRDYRHYKFRIVSMSDGELGGKDQDGEPIQVPFEDIASLQVRVPRPGRTAGAVAGGLVGGVVAVYALAIGVALAVLGGLSSGS